MTSAIPFRQKRQPPDRLRQHRVEMIRLVAQVLPGGVHQFEGVADAVAGELAVALDDVAANDHRLEKLEHVAAGHGIVLLPLSTAVFYTRPGVAHSHVSDIPPNQVCLAWDATRRSRLIRDFAAIAADHPPVASRAEPGCVSSSGAQTPA